MARTGAAFSSSAIAQDFLKLRHVLLQLISKLGGQNIVGPLIILLSINSLIWYLKSGISSRLKQSLCPWVIIRLWVGGGSNDTIKISHSSQLLWHSSRFLCVRRRGAISY